MAKLPRTGVGYQFLYEYDCTLPQVMGSLGLKPLSRKVERQIRNQLGFALAKWEEPYTAIEVKDVVRSLTAHAKRLDQIDSIGTITRRGFARGHNLAVSGQVVQVLASDPKIGSVQAAHAYLSDFCERADTIAFACRAAVSTLQAKKGKGGKSRYDWYDEFTAVLVQICKRNKIEPTIGIDRITGEPVGGLSAVAAGFERLLLPNMRSRTPSAMVKRLQRSLDRIGQKSVTVHMPGRSCFPARPRAS
jgi:hypothetical protein